MGRKKAGPRFLLFSKSKAHSLTHEQLDESPIDDIEAIEAEGDSPSVPEYNILLLGESGSGKSTTINAFANYLQYTSFDEAVASELIQAIPSQIVLPNHRNGEPIVFKSGTPDANECLDGDIPSTKAPKSYSFHLDSATIRFIDTPGIGNEEVDKSNFDKILQYLHCYEKLHAICILLKANETRQTASFRYCINQLLTHLHKSACKNIIFCFTFSRNSEFGAGEGFTTLSGFLSKEMPELDLQLKTGVNCYFVDNEAYRFLIAKKSGYPFRLRQENSYRESWSISSDQMHQMVQHILYLEPHSLKETCSLYAARKLVIELVDSMVKLHLKNSANMKRLEEEKKRIVDESNKRDKFVSEVNVEAEDIEIRPLPKPITVCTAKKCIELIQVGERMEIDYKTRCHVDCVLSTSNSIGDPELKNCTAMNGPNGCCTNCGCYWTMHQIKEYEMVKVKRTIVDTVKKSELEKTTDLIERRAMAKCRLEKEMKEFQEELEVIEDICAKFAYILADNSSTAKCRFIEPHLDLLIEEEKQKAAFEVNYPRLTYDFLVAMKETHEKKVHQLAEAIAQEDHPEVTIEQIGEYRAKLLRLKHSGPQIRQIIQTVDKSTKEHAKPANGPALRFTKLNRTFIFYDAE